MPSFFRLSIFLFLVGVLVLPQVAKAGGEMGKGRALSVWFDRGLEGKNPNECNQLNQVSDYLEPDLVRRLKREGYVVSTIAAKEDFDPAKRGTLLVVKTMHYNPGAKAARVLVGFGAGAASLDLRYELYGEGDVAFWTKDHGRASGNDWRRICSVLNRDLVVFLRTSMNGRQ